MLPTQDIYPGVQNNDLVTQCLFARLCSHAMQILHGREVRHTQETGEIDECVRLVQAWKVSTISECHITALDKLSTSIQSFELLLCIYAQELLQPAHATRFEHALLSILNEAQDILRLLNDIDNVVMAANWYGFCGTPTLSFIFLSSADIPIPHSHLQSAALTLCFLLCVCVKSPKGEKFSCPTLNGR